MARGYISLFIFFHIDLIEHTERTRLDKIKALKERLEDAKHQLEVAQRQGHFELASRLRFSTIPELEKQLPEEQSETPEDEESPTMMMLHDRVTSNDISRVVAKATGIPVQNLLKGERDKLIHVSAFLNVDMYSVLIDIFSRWMTIYVIELLVKTTSCKQSLRQCASLALASRHQIGLSLRSYSSVPLV